MIPKFRIALSLTLAVLLIAPLESGAARLQAKTVRDWESYVQLTEKRIAEELDSNSGFLTIDFITPAEGAKARSLLKSGQVYIQKLSTKDANGRQTDVSDGLIHHWFGAIFVPTVSISSVLRWVQNYDRHSQYFKEVEQSRLVSRDGDTFNIFLRLERKKIVTVHYNTEHTVVYRVHSADNVSSRSHTTKIAEIQNAGAASEKEKPVGDDSGFFWRLNSYWRFKAQDGGVVVECESISLSRSIPFGFGWLIKGFVESVPRESLESTLISMRDGIVSAVNGR